MRQAITPTTLSLSTALDFVRFAGGLMVRPKHWRQPVCSDCEAIMGDFPDMVKRVSLLTIPDTQDRFRYLLT